MKNPLKPAGIEQAAFRFVAQHLNHCATAVFEYVIIASIISLKWQTAQSDNNNNNNNIYLLQLGCYPVAVVILHLNKT